MTTKPHRFAATVILEAILAYKKREGEYPSQRALCVEAERSLAHVNAMVKHLVDQGYVRLSKSGGRIIEAHYGIVTDPDKEKSHDPV